ncbi:MAG: hypothetical protein KF861_10870 [Planctomycetaceae bacterium]|nr:hypothetical protein [Planctomycetaceae bacterium]
MAFTLRMMQRMYGGNVHLRVYADPSISGSTCNQIAMSLEVHPPRRTHLELVRAMPARPLPHGGGSVMMGETTEPMHDFTEGAALCDVVPRRCC